MEKRPILIEQKTNVKKKEVMSGMRAFVQIKFGLFPCCCVLSLNEKNHASLTPFTPLCSFH